MSFVSSVKYGRTPVREVLKLLEHPEQWELNGEGGNFESFIHKESGWKFYTGASFAALYKDHFKMDIGFFRWFWFGWTKKERKFVQRWLELKENNDEKHS